MGTTVQSIAGRANPADGPHPHPGPGQPLFGQRGGNWPQQPPQHSVESPEATFTTPAQNGGVFNSHAQALGPPFDNHGPGHPPRMANQAPAGAPGPVAQPPRNTHTPTPGAGPGLNGSGAQQGGLERRGPVEFNHAISYVNKIKVSCRSISPSLFPLAHFNGLKLRPPFHMLRFQNIHTLFEAFVLKG